MKQTNRCQWASKTELEREYHDAEWAIPITDDKVHFEMIILEGAQSGLSWHTILVKRSTYRIAFKGFDPKEVAKFTEHDVEVLLQNPGIVRYKQKINSTINNAKCFINIQREFGSFNQYIWSFVNFSPVNNGWESEESIPTSTPLSDVISKDLKKRGFKFVGTTTIYAYMQSIGMVNDHVTSCFRYKDVVGSQQIFIEANKTPVES